MDSSRYGQSDEDAQIARQIAHLESIVKPKMTREALGRYANVKLAHPEIAISALAGMTQMVQRGTSEITDEALKNLLKMLTSRREINIKRK